MARAAAPALEREGLQRQAAAQTELGRALKRFHASMHRIKAAFVHNYRYNALQRGVMLKQWELWEAKRYNLKQAQAAVKGGSGPRRPRSCPATTQATSKHNY